MTTAELNDLSLPAFNEAFDGIDALSEAGESPARDDLSLCFVCLRWTSGDHDCRTGTRCEYQRVLDQLDSQP